MRKNIGRLEEELLREVDEAAKRFGQTRMAFVRFALKARVESYRKVDEAES